MDHSKNQGTDIDRTTDFTFRALRTTCLSLPIDKQAFNLAVRFFAMRKTNRRK